MTLINCTEIDAHFWVVVTRLLAQVSEPLFVVVACCCVIEAGSPDITIGVSAIWFYSFFGLLVEVVGSQSFLFSEVLPSLSTC